MSSVIFSSPSNVRSIIIEDVSAFSVSGLMTKKVFDDIKIDSDSHVLVLGTELHPSFPRTADSWKLLLKHELVEYQSLINIQCDKDDLLSYMISRIEAFCNKNKNAIVIINLTVPLLTNPSSKVSRLLRKYIFMWNGGLVIYHNMLIVLYK